MRYRLYWAALHCASLLPFPILFFLADLVCPVVHHIVRYRLRVVRENLRSAFPDKTDKELRTIEDKFYHQLCDVFVEVVKQGHMSKAETMRHMEFSGLENIRQCFEEGAPYVFVMLGHYGNWEWISSLQYWLPDIHCSQIYHKLYDNASDRLFLRLREKYGGECVEMKTTLRHLLQMRRQHAKIVVGFIADQQPKMSAIHYFTPFLGHDTAVFTGAEQLAQRLGARLVFGHVTRTRRGYYHCHMEHMPISEAAEGEYPLTDLYMQLLEADIRQVPELWLWTHKRWSRTREKWEIWREQQAAEAHPHN